MIRAANAEDAKLELSEHPVSSQSCRGKESRDTTTGGKNRMTEEGHRRRGLETINIQIESQNRVRKAEER